jgi:hypothetical protein
MKKNKSWTLCNVKDAEGVRVYKVSGEYILTNYRDSVLAVVPRCGRSPKVYRLFADLMASGFSDAFWGFICGRGKSDDSLECLVCNESHLCSGLKHNDENCILRKQFEEEFGT